MKRTIGISLILTLVLLATITLFAKGVIGTFFATYDGLDIRLTWSATDEKTVKNYEIYRRSENDPDFIKLGTVEATGGQSYYFVDANLYKSQSGFDQVQTLYYKLTVINKNGSNEVYYTSVAHNPTAIQRSWGSIKAMFR